MADMQWLLEVVLILLLAATLFYALRLERALRALRDDRSELEGLIEDFTKSTTAADAGIARLHAAAREVGRDLARHSAEGLALKDDLAFLTKRAEYLVGRLGGTLRSAHPAGAHRMLDDPRSPRPPGPTPEPRGKSEAERELLRALKMAR